jgi:thiamine biosynthesis lipoprotein
VVADTLQRASAQATTRVMSCEATVLVTTSEPIDRDTSYASTMARQAVERLHQLEQRWSRFLPTSEISGLNAAGGEPRIASPDTVRLVTELVQAWHATSGAFDPTLLGTLVELGYAASRDDATLRTSLNPDVAPQGRPAEILVDADTGWVQLPHGTTLDPGGLGKGLAADIVVEELLDIGAAGALVEIGGDIRVAGRPPRGEAWTIAITPIGEGEEPRTVQLCDGGVATSTSRLRTWTDAGEQRHHLLDPQTLRSAQTDTVSCSVIAGSAAWAEAFTKIAFVEPIVTALECSDIHGLATSITTADHRRHDSHVWKEFCR